MGRLEDYVIITKTRDKPADYPRDPSLDKHLFETKYTKDDDSFADAPLLVMKRKLEFSEDAPQSRSTARKSMFFKQTNGKEGSRRSASSKKKPVESTTSRTEHTQAASIMFSHLELIKNTGLVDLKKLKASPVTRGIELEKLAEANGFCLNAAQSKQANASNGSKRLLTRNRTSKVVRSLHT